MISSVILCSWFMTAPQVCAVYNQIVKNSPKISATYAKTLSEKIVTYAQKYNIKPKIFTAILRQESNYKLSAKNCTSGTCKDFGISQINAKTIDAFKFDRVRLLTDLDYSIEAGAIVLADFKRMYFKREGYSYWCRFNSSKPTLRQKYRTLVARYL